MSHCSCGGCGCSACAPTNCSPSPRCTIQLPEGEVQTYQFENQNLSGIGFFNDETNFNVGFRGLVSDSLALILTLDAPNAVIRLDFDGDLLINDIPDATTTQRGMLETATDGEAIAKLALNKTLTPSNLAALGASTTFAGLVELATSAETIAGVDTTRAVTPAGLAATGNLYRTVTFADAVALNAGVPAFDGQFASQLDTEQAFVAASTSAGDWNPLFTFGTTYDIAGATTLIYTIGTTTFNGSGTGVFAYNAMNVNLSVGSQLTIDSGCVFGVKNDSTIEINGSPMGASQLFGTDAAGEIAPRAIANFLSTSNLQSGWSVTNPSVTRTLDVAASDLATTRAVLGTLINDLKAVLLPSS